MNETKTIERYLLDEVGRSLGRAAVGEDEDLIEGGLLDSVTLVRLVSFLEQSFSVEIRDEDVVPENFRTLATIVGLVTRRRSAAVA